MVVFLFGTTISPRTSDYMFSSSDMKFSTSEFKNHCWSRHLKLSICSSFLLCVQLFLLRDMVLFCDIIHYTMCIFYSPAFMEVVGSAKGMKTQCWSNKVFHLSHTYFKPKVQKLSVCILKKCEGTGGVMTHTLAFFGSIYVGKLAWLETEVFQTGRRIR